MGKKVLSKARRESILRELNRRRGGLPAGFKFNRDEANERRRGGRAVRVSKWGNSLAVRLPAAIVDALALEQGDQIELTLTDARSLDVSRAKTIKERLDALERFRGRMPRNFKFDRDEANKR